MSRSPLRWAGSKRSLLPVIRSVTPSFEGIYIEPFMGSACVFFDALPSRARLSDTNSHLVDFFRELRDDVAGLVSAYAAWDSAGDDYYRVREYLPEDLTPSERAARFLYLNRFSFNGVYRTNRKGQFNVPRGSRTGKLPSFEELQEISGLLCNVELRCEDHLVATSDSRPEDFVYLDPPYRNESRPTYGEYGYGSFASAADVRDLSAELVRLTDQGTKVLLSFNDDEELLDALEGWTVIRIERRRTVAGRAAARTSLTGEILAYNYSIGPDA